MESGLTNTPSSEGKPQIPSATTSRYERDAWYGEFTEDDFSFFDRPESTRGGKDNRTVESGRSTSRGRSSSPNASNSSHYRGTSGDWTVDVDSETFELNMDFPLNQHASAAWGTPFGQDAIAPFAGSQQSSTPALSKSPEATPASLDRFPQTPNDFACLEHGPQTDEFKYVSRVSTSTDENSITAFLGVSYPEMNETSTFEAFAASPASPQNQASRSPQADLLFTRAALTIPSQPINPHDSHQPYLTQNLFSPPFNCSPKPFTSDRRSQRMETRGKSMAQLPEPEPAAAKPSRGEAGARKRKRAAKGSASSHHSLVPGSATPARPSEGGPQRPALTPIEPVVRTVCQFQHLDGVPPKKCLDVLPENPGDIRAHLKAHYKALGYKHVNYVPCPFCLEKFSQESPGEPVRQKVYRLGDLSKHVVDHHVQARRYRCPCGGSIGRLSESFQCDRHFNTKRHQAWLKRMAAEEAEKVWLIRMAAEEAEEVDGAESDDERDEGSSDGVKRRRLS